MLYQTLLFPLAGGALIGLAALSLLYFNGRIAGISGIMGGLLSPTRGDIGWRAAFLGGLLAGGIALLLLFPEALPATPVRSLPLLAVGGLLVGFGTRLGSGCTSGHGVCGLGRRSARSLAATMTFIISGAAAVYAVRLFS